MLVKFPATTVRNAAVMSKTMNKLNNNNVTGVTFLGRGVAVIFYSSLGPLSEPVSGLFLGPSWLQSTITGEAVWTLTPQPAESWEKKTFVRQKRDPGTLQVA